MGDFDVDYDGELPGSVDEAALKRMETAAYVLDESVRVPGIGVRIDINPILGALPVAGDVVSGAFSCTSSPSRRTPSICRNHHPPPINPIANPPIKKQCDGGADLGGYLCCFPSMVTECS